MATLDYSHRHSRCRRSDTARPRNAIARQIAELTAILRADYLYEVHGPFVADEPSARSPGLIARIARVFPRRS